MYVDLVRYLKTYYFDNNAFMRWTACYQPDVYTNMETNNYVESWHNQLKTTYLRRKQNKRVDRLIFILVKDVEYDYQNNVRRLMLNVGRMNPEQRRVRAREITAEAINSESIDDMIQQENESFYAVQSFSSNGIVYQVEVNDCQMIKCTCEDFQYNRIACKHMYLLHYLKNTIQIFEGNSGKSTMCSLLINAINIVSFSELIPSEIAQEMNTAVGLHQEIDNLINKLANLLATCHAYKGEPHLLNDYDLAQVEQGANMIMEVINRNRNNRSHPNQNFSTQRR